MKISELIKELEKQKQKHGDLEIWSVDSYGEPTNDPEVWVSKRPIGYGEPKLFVSG